jgi:hypothetical protein
VNGAKEMGQKQKVDISEVGKLIKSALAYGFLRLYRVHHGGMVSPHECWVERRGWIRSGQSCVTPVSGIVIYRLSACNFMLSLLEFRNRRNLFDSRLTVGTSRFSPLNILWLCLPAC